MVNRKNFFLSFLVVFSLKCSEESLVFHEYFLNTLRESKYTKEIPTELTAYKLLKQKPILKKINYVIAPWSDVIKEGRFKEELEKIHVDGGFTVCQVDKFYWAMPLFKKMGIKVVFTPHAGCAPWTYGDIVVVPFPHVASNGVKPRIKNIFYSFIGAHNCLARTRLFKMKHPANAVVIRRERWHYHQPDRKKMMRERAEYKDVLARSRFSLCPLGTGLGSIRFWESLEAGAIPVLIADGLLLPNGFDWSSCVIRVEQRLISKIPFILSKITPLQEKRMRINCLKAYELFSGENLVKVIRDYYQ